MSETVKIWTELALSDLKSSIILYDNKQFRTSYFLFQQASEKANKAFAILGGQFNEKRIKKIGHDQFKIFTRTIRIQGEVVKNLINCLKPFPKVINHKVLAKRNLNEYGKSLNESINFIDNLSQHDLVNISLTDLNIILKQLKKIRESKIKIPLNFENDFKKGMLNIADWVGQFETKEAIEAKLEFHKLISDKEEVKKLYTLVTDEILPLMLEISTINLTLYFCAIITIQHSSLTRYPEQGNNPIVLYTSKLPLIKKQKDFMNHLMYSLNKISKLNTN
jgi:HEPN domain-containing protein